MIEWYQILYIGLTIYTGLMSVIGIILWYIIRSTISDLRSLEKALEAHKLNTATDYAKISDVKEANNRLVTSLDTLQGTINNLALTVATLSASLHKEVAK